MEGVVSGDVDVALIGQDASFNLPVREAGTEGERDVFVHGLEGLEDKGVACRHRLDTVGEGNVNNIDEKGRGKESNSIIVVVGGGKEVGTAREGIRAGEEFSWDVDHFQVEVSKVNEPTGLSLVEVLGEMEVGEVCMVGEDLDREKGSMKVVLPGFQGMNNTKEFSVVDVVVSFCRGERLGEVGAGVPVAVQVGLEKDGTRSILGSVSGDSEGCGKVGEV